jgi:CDP-4-dehydro-6-deoxyglucose reductase
MAYLHIMKLYISEIIPRGDVRIIRFLKPDNFPSFLSGHFAKLLFNGLESPRSYSIASPPHTTTIDFHIKIGAGSSAETIRQLRQGDNVTLVGIQGHYGFDAPSDRPVLLVAGGTGLAPMHSILLTLLHKKPQHKIDLFLGGRTFDELYWHDNLLQLAQQYSSFGYYPVLSEQLIDGFMNGMVGDRVIDHLQHSHSVSYDIYMAGPVDMQRDFYQKALTIGIIPSDIHSDLVDFK